MISRRKRVNALLAASMLVVTVGAGSAGALQLPIASRPPILEWDEWLLGDAEGVAVSPSGEVWVVDGEMNRIVRYDTSGTFLGHFGSKGSGAGQFRSPSGLAFAPDGSFYVIDGGNHRIQKFDADKNPVLAWGSQGTGDGEFESPRSIDLDGNGDVFVLDRATWKVQVFSAGGTHLRTLPGSFYAMAVHDTVLYSFAYSPGKVIVAAHDLFGQPLGNTIEVPNAPRNIPGTWGLRGLNVDPTGMLYIGVSAFHQTVRALPNGFICDALELNIPQEEELVSYMSTDAAGNVYFTESRWQGGVERVLKFAPAPCGDASMIRGTITDGLSGDPLADVKVLIYPENGSGALAGATSNADGTFDLRMPAGNYRLRTVATPTHPQVWWTATTPAPWWSAPQVVAGAGTLAAPTQQVTTADLHVPPTAELAALTGSVTDGVSPLAGIRVGVYRPSGLVAMVTTGPDGAFELSNMAPGTYRVKFSDPLGSSTSQWWNGHTTYFAGEDVTLSLGSITTLPPVALGPA